MSTTMLGLDVGASALKMALVSGDRVQKAAAEPLPDNLIREDRITSLDAMAHELKDALRRHRITARKCALVLPPESAIVRRITVPYMTVEQLQMNLPYEFHDYIQSDKDLFFYDYAVVETRLGEDGQPRELDLIAAAARRETVAEYRLLLRKAGLKLAVAVPECLTYRNLIRAYERSHPDHPAEYCAVDMGHRAIRMHMYRGTAYETTRVVEFGGAALDALIADAEAVDPHLAAGYKRSNYDGAQEIPACRDLYARIAVELLRAVNFYGFNTPDADLKDVWLGGGLAKVTALTDEIRENLELSVHPVEDLLPAGAESADAALCAAAAGAALQSGGR